MNPKVVSIWRKTKKVVTDNDRVNQVLKQAGVKLSRFTASEESKGKLTQGIKLMMRMIRSQLNGSYDAFSAKSMFLMVFAIVYFVIPTDMIPDIIPMLGFTDDLTVLYFVMDSISDDIQDFKIWEEDQKL